MTSGASSEPSRTGSDPTGLAGDSGYDSGDSAGLGDDSAGRADDSAAPVPVLGHVVAGALALVLGVVVGLVGTVAHRGAPPWGLVVAVAATLSAAVLARSLSGGVALATYAAGLLVVTQLANGLRPAGDILVAGDALGYAWLALPLLMCAVVAFLPNRWFAPAPAGL